LTFWSKKVLNRFTDSGGPHPERQRERERERHADVHSQENSTRVYPKNGWTMQPPLRCAANVMPADALNQPSKQGQHWTVEIALPLASLVQKTGSNAQTQQVDLIY